MSDTRELYLVRHAIAAPRGAEWPDDSARPLTAEGIERLAEVVSGLVSLDVQLDEVFTSPPVRARQTAKILAGGVRGKPSVKILDALSPGSEPKGLMSRLPRASTCRQVALVGREPDLGELAAYLIGAARALPFKKGGVCRIDVASVAPRHDGTLRCFATPKMLRALGDRARRAR